MNGAAVAATAHANLLARFDITEIKAHPPLDRLWLHIPGNAAARNSCLAFLTRKHRKLAARILYLPMA
jgi:hypothetical protein